MLSKLLIIRTAASFILPLLILYAVLIQINGEISPGGGFQAGVLLASAVICQNLITENDKKLFRDFNIISWLRLATLGVMIYFGCGLVAFLKQENYLDYHVLAKNPHFAQSLGIFIIEIGVGITVFSSMCLIFLSFEQIKNEK